MKIAGLALILWRRNYVMKIEEVLKILAKDGEVVVVNVLYAGSRGDIYKKFRG